jgi:hypothetical protein
MLSILKSFIIPINNVGLWCKWQNLDLNIKIALFRNAGHSGRAVWGVGLDRVVAGNVGSNPAQGMDVCPRLFVLCCPVWIEALRRADRSSKES